MTSEEIRDAVGRLRELGTGGCIFRREVVDAMFDSSSNYEVRDRLIGLLEQADPDTHMELPVDADGEHIHIGDELVSNHSKKKIVVTRLQYSREHAWMVGGADKDDLSEYGLYAPCETRHYHKPAVSEILDELEGLRGTGDYESVVMRAAELAGMLRELI